MRAVERAPGRRDWDPGGRLRRAQLARPSPPPSPSPAADPDSQWPPPPSDTFCFDMHPPLPPAPFILTSAPSTVDSALIPPIATLAFPPPQFLVPGGWIWSVRRLWTSSSPASSPTPAPVPTPVMLPSLPPSPPAFPAVTPSSSCPSSALFSVPEATFVLVFASFLHAPGPTMAAEDMKITLISCVGVELEVGEIVDLEIQAFHYVIADGCAVSGIQLPIVTAKFLAMVFEFCKMHVVSAAKPSTPVVLAFLEDLLAWDVDLVLTRADMMGPNGVETFVLTRADMMGLNGVETFVFLFPDLASTDLRFLLLGWRLLALLLSLVSWYCWYCRLGGGIGDPLIVSAEFHRRLEEDFGAALSLIAWFPERHFRVLLLLGVKGGLWRCSLVAVERVGVPSSDVGSSSVDSVGALVCVHYDPGSVGSAPQFRMLGLASSSPVLLLVGSVLLLRQGFAACSLVRVVGLSAVLMSRSFSLLKVMWLVSARLCLATADGAACGVARLGSVEAVGASLLSSFGQGDLWDVRLPPLVTVCTMFSCGSSLRGWAWGVVVRLSSFSRAWAPDHRRFLSLARSGIG